MSEKAISVTEALHNFSLLIDRAAEHGESTLLLKNGKPVARVVPVTPRPKTGKELAESWITRHHLTSLGLP